MNRRLASPSLSTLALGLTLTACNATPPGEQPAPGDDSPQGLSPAPCPAPAPLLAAPRDPVAGSYIVVFKDEVTDSLARTAELERHHGFTATYRYSSALKGFAARLPADTVAALRCEPDVDYLEEDAEVRVE
jgi:aqualysin 1